MAKYAGADWIEESLKKPLSPLGVAVADLLGQVWAGIYHLPHTLLARVDWAESWYISVTVPGSELATYDADLLTRLVVLCHDRCLRMEIEPCNPRYLRLNFSPRVRSATDPRMHRRCPTMEQAVASVRERFGSGESWESEALKIELRHNEGAAADASGDGTLCGPREVAGDAASGSQTTGDGLV